MTESYGTPVQPVPYNCSYPRARVRQNAETLVGVLVSPQ